MHKHSINIVPNIILIDWNQCLMQVINQFDCDMMRHLDKQCAEMCVFVCVCLGCVSVGTFLHSLLSMSPSSFRFHIWIIMVGGVVVLCGISAFVLSVSVYLSLLSLGVSHCLYLCFCLSVSLYFSTKNT